MFLMYSCNQHCLVIFVSVSFGILIVIIFIRRWFINYYQDQIFILRGVLDEIDEILNEIPRDGGVSILVFLLHGRLVY